MKKCKMLLMVLGLISITGCGTLFPVLQASMPAVEAGLANNGVNVKLDLGEIFSSFCLAADSAFVKGVEDKVPAGAALLPLLVPVCPADES